MSSSRRILYSCINSLVLILVMFSTALRAQTVTATLSGTVDDPQGAVIGNVTVTVTDTATGASRKLQTDNGGRFVANNLQPDPYTLKAELTGFAPQTVSGI